MSDVKEQIKNDYLSGVSPKKLSEKYDTSLNTIKSWIKRYGWSKLKKERGAPSKIEGAPSVVPAKRKRGGQPGNKNATGPPGNKHAEKFGFFSKHLPEETLSIIREMPEDPLDVLWDQIQIAYAAIIRAQKIMYAETKEEAIALYKRVPRLLKDKGRTDPDRKWMRRSDQRERRTVRRGRHGRSEGTV